MANQKNEAAKALQDATDVLDSAVDTAKINAASAPLVKEVAKDSLNEYAGRIKPDDMTTEEKADFDTALENAVKTIDGVANNKAVAKALADAKAAVKEVVDQINDNRETNAAVEDAKAAADAAKAAAESAKQNKYASNTDKTAIDNAVKSVNDAIAAIEKATNNEEAKKAAAAAKKAVDALESATNKANSNSTAAKAAAEAEAARKAAEAEAAAAKKAAEAKALSDAKTNATDRLEDLYDAKNVSDYRTAQQKALKNAVNSGKKAINAAKTPAAAKSALAAAKKAVNAIKTDAELSKEEAAAEKAKKEEAAKKAAAEKTKKDKAAASNAVNVINSIGKVTANSSKKIAAAKKAYNALTADQRKLVPAEVVAKLNNADTEYAKAVKTKYAGKAAKAKNAQSLNAKLKVTQTKNKINVSWGSVKTADEYRVYIQYCSKKFSKTATVTVPAPTRKVSVSQVNGAKLKLKNNFKVYVAAYKTIDGKKTRIGKTITAHIVGRKNAKYTNAKKIVITSSKNVTLTAGQSSKITAKTILVNKKKSQLPNNHAKQFRYRSSNKKVATVTSKGMIKAVGKGKCTVYVFSRNGLAKKVTVTVN